MSNNDTDRKVKVASDWQPQQYRDNAPATTSHTVLTHALATVGRIVSADSAQIPILTLGHLAQLTGVIPRELRQYVERTNGKADYRTFMLAKHSLLKSRGFRMISIPTPKLKHVQRWIHDNILCQHEPHAASTAYFPGCSISKAVETHLGCRWLIKLDVQAFFDSISEIRVQRVFESFGYQPLVAFELTRLCTYEGNTATAWRNHQRWKTRPGRLYKIRGYRRASIGYLPQGAPTSPALANLAMSALDRKLTKLAATSEFVYSRYADDLAFSTRRKNVTRADCTALIHEVYKALGSEGLSPNLTKTLISPPGSRRLLLGVLVNGKFPRLTKDFRSKMRCHLHYLEKFGAVEHAKARGFDSYFGLRNYVVGLARFARQIEPEYGHALLERLAAVWSA